MKKIQEEITEKVKYSGFLPSQFVKGWISGMNRAEEIVGSCNACGHSFIAGSDLRCKFRMWAVPSDGYCDEYVLRKRK